MFQGDYGKPRPAVVVETDYLASVDSVLLCLVTSDILEHSGRRIDLEPSASNGLRLRSQVQADKIFALRRQKCGKPIGVLNARELEQLNEALMLVLGLGD